MSSAPILRDLTVTNLNRPPGPGSEWTAPAEHLFTGRKPRPAPGVALDPEYWHVIGLKPPVGREERASLDDGLGEQHAVERVGVMGWQGRDSRRVGETHRQLPESALVDACLERPGESQPAQRRLDGNFPGRRAADEDRVGGGDRSPARAPEAAVIRPPPDDDVCIEEEFHRGVRVTLARRAGRPRGPRDRSPSKPRCRSAGSGASKSTVGHGARTVQVGTRIVSSCPNS